MFMYHKVIILFYKKIAQNNLYTYKGDYMFSLFLLISGKLLLISWLFFEAQYHDRRLGRTIITRNQGVAA